MRILVTSFFLVSTLLIASQMGFSQNLPKLGDRLTDKQATAFAKLALTGMNQEYPNKPSNVMVGPQSLKSPKDMHPAFYGCFDWHSSVHGHWMLVRLLKHYPNNSMAGEIREKLNQHLTAENLQAEAAHFAQKHNKAFERMYGWAWYFRLVIECETWDDKDAQLWRKNLQPLEKMLVRRTMDYLPKLTFPVRTGVHPNTAFALGQTLDYARIVKNESLEKLIVKRSRDYYGRDRDYPFDYEPSGQDFFSAGWNEADLMRRVLDKDEFARWFDDFLPGLSDKKGIQSPVEVSDVTDGKIVHLAGLDLSRAWCLQGVAAQLDEDDPRRKLMLDSAAAHAKVGFKYVFSGNYAGEHWLATFAVYTVDQVGAELESKKTER